MLLVRSRTAVTNMTLQLMPPRVWPTLQPATKHGWSTNSFAATSMTLQTLTPRVNPTLHPAMLPTTAGWTKFWNFAVRNHPCLNLSEITIITDQDKGQIAVIAEVCQMHSISIALSTINKTFPQSSRQKLTSRCLVAGCLIS